MRTFSRLCCLLAVLAILIGPASAQVTTGTIVGVVEDSTGAIIINAKVTAVHQGTGESREVRTNDRGEFNFPFLHIGEYTLTAEASGFRSQRQTGIELQVDKTVKLQIAMAVGGVTESVEVTAAAPLIDASTSSLGQVIGNQKIAELPLNGRNAFALGLLSGNTVPVTGMATNLPFVAGGGRFALNDVLLDGIDNNSSVNSGNIGRNGIAYTPSVDAVEEFKVKTSSFSAEFGRSAGAIVSANTKSGTNEYHGSGWDFLRNEKLDANNFFSNAGSVARQPFKQNQFGFTMGGPTSIPKIYKAKDHTFFFVDYEGMRRRTTASSTISGHSADGVPKRRFFHLQARHLRSAGAQDRAHGQRHLHAVSGQYHSAKHAEPRSGGHHQPAAVAQFRRLWGAIAQFSAHRASPV